MKKILSLLLMGFAIMAEPFIAHFKTAHSDSLIIAQAEDADAIKSREVNPKNFDYGTYMRNENDIAFSSLPSWTPDQIDRMELESGSADEVNYSAGVGNYLLNTDRELDILSSFLGSEEIQNIETSISQSHTYFKSLDGIYYCLYYKSVKPIIYFDQSISGVQNISFYIDIGWDMNLMTDLKKQLPLLIGEMPLIVINDEYTFLKIDFKETSWKLVTDNYSRIDPCKRDPIFTNEASPKLLCRVTIPFIDHISNIKVLQTISGSSNPSGNLDKATDLFFAFDASMNDKYYFYLFDICSLSVLKKELIVDNSTYYGFRHPSDGKQYDDFMADLVSMKILFSGTKKSAKLPIIPMAKNATGGSGGSLEKIPFYYEPILPKVIDLNFDRNVGYADGKVRYWYFDEFDLEENVSGQIKILSISFHPYYFDDTTKRYEIDESTTLVHNYENTNIHKYSFDADKGVRTYYYKMSSYIRYYDENGDWYDHIYGWAINMFRNYHCFGFSFYFDSLRRFPIPNVKKLTFKYQCGYEVPNPEEGSNGFYPNGSDESKNIKVRTMEVVENKVRRLGALDSEGMCLTNNAAKKMMTDDNGVTYDYVLYKWRKRGTGPAITTMDALEIIYETKAYEMVRMVSNSQGLHVVVDDDGVARVYDAEGNPVEDYGVYKSEDGTMVPGKDANGDGVISSDEVVNSDTGEKNYLSIPISSSSIQSFIDNIKDFFNSKKERWISIAVVGVVIISAFIFVPKLMKRKKH